MLKTISAALVAVSVLAMPALAGTPGKTAQASVNKITQAPVVKVEQGKAKLRHIARNPRVSLNFNTDKDGGDVAVLIGEARVLDEPPPQARVESYLKKYTKGIKSLDMTVDEFRAAYSVPILVTPQSMRGLID